FKAVTNFILRGIWVALKKLRGGQNHAGRAVAALQAVSFPETFLHRVKLAVAAESFDCSHLSAVGLHGKDRAGLDCLTVLDDCASAAERCLAANVCARQPKHISKIMYEQHARLDFVLMLSAVDVYADSFLHLLCYLASV